MLREGRRLLRSRLPLLSPLSDRRAARFEFAVVLRDTHAVKLLALALVFAGCAVASPRPPVAATSDAPTGRLADAPAALQPGVVTYPDLPAPSVEPPPMHHHHP